MKDEPKPAVWFCWTLVFAALTVTAAGSWWQVLTLTLLAVSGGTWAVDNMRWEQRKANVDSLIAKLAAGQISPNEARSQLQPEPQQGRTKGIH